ncbi:MAG TPA: hypothetical protein VHO23_00240 [Candidatus Paceibacterota bacterium]|nr:hypothetical protein [Candidatus Paceibacterota bacterium]
MEKYLTPFFVAVAVAAVALVAIGSAYYVFRYTGPTEDWGAYESGIFSFSYPSGFMHQEYSAGAVAIGKDTDDAFAPQVEVTRYRSDIDRPLPPSYDEFVLRQLTALCGTDSGNERVSCSNLVAEPYTSAHGYVGEKLSLTVTRTNLSSGTTSATSFAPLYVFRTRYLATPPEPVQYEGIFVYPTFASALEGDIATDALDKVLETLVIPRLDQAATGPAGAE